MASLEYPVTGLVVPESGAVLARNRPRAARTSAKTLADTATAKATTIVYPPATASAASAEPFSRRRLLLGGGSTWFAIAAASAISVGAVAAPPPANAVEGAFEMDMRFYAKQLLNGNDQTTKRPTDDVPEVTKSPLFGFKHWHAVLICPVRTTVPSKPDHAASYLHPSPHIFNSRQPLTCPSASKLCLITLQFTECPTTAGLTTHRRRDC